MVLQRSISESVLRSFRKTRADPALGTAPVVNRYKTVSLLVLPPVAEVETNEMDAG